MENFNLSRKWRSKNFEQLIGQELVVKLLKNSLYKNHLFPVYIFAGQKGSGKTSAARIFAAALNCKKLTQFQNDATFSIPCFSCISCNAFYTQQHPDFIEIDAASYTGVENIRNIIDSASFLPVLGVKKVYLIDEVHMLSKSAFNAFLKILEEPLASVVFILATTDISKILDTVRSRSLQLYFSPINSEQISKHLEFICAAESIIFESSALQLLADFAQGSLRDALNLLEQVFITFNIVNEAAVLNCFNFLDIEFLFKLFELLLDKKIKELLLFCAEIKKKKIAIEYLWNSLIELFYAAISLKYGLFVKKFNFSISLLNKIEHVELQFLIKCLDILCKEEATLKDFFSKSIFLELTFLRFFEFENYALVNSLEGASLADNSFNKKEEQFEINFEKKEKIDFVGFIEKNKKNISLVEYKQYWNDFVGAIKLNTDPLILSILKESQFLRIDKIGKTFYIACLKKFIVFADFLIKNKADLDLEFSKFMRENFNLEFVFELNSDAEGLVEKKRAKEVFVANDTEIAIEKKKIIYSSKSNNIKKQADKILDISDKNSYKIANLLSDAFEGQAYEFDSHDGEIENFDK